MCEFVCDVKVHKVLTLLNYFNLRVCVVELAEYMGNIYMLCLWEIHGLFHIG